MSEVLDVHEGLIVVDEVPYGDEVFTMTIGMNDELARQLVAYSKMEPMPSMVPKDQTKRFPTIEKAHEWRDKGDRFVTTLWAGRVVEQLVWFGESSLEDEVRSLRTKGAEIKFEVPEGADHTFAIRNYDATRAERRVKPADEPLSVARMGMIEGQNLYVEQVRRVGGEVAAKFVWLETNLNDKSGARNRSVYLYEKAGYEELGTYVNPDPTNPEMRIAMVRPLEMSDAEQGGLVLPE